MTDDTFEKWLESSVENAEEEKRKQALNQKTVINLSRPQVGDVFTFLPNEFWEIVHILPLNTDYQVNQAIILLRSSKDTLLYSVPHRKNGNLERCTLQSLPQAFIHNLFTLTESDSDMTEIQMIVRLSDVPTEVSWSEKYDGWSIDFQTSDQSLMDNDIIKRIQWAIGLYGGLYRGPFLIVRYDKDRYRKTRNQIMNLLVHFPLLDANPEPDATLLEDMSSLVRTVEINPLDIEASVITLLQYFAAADLIKVIRKFS